MRIRLLLFCALALAAAGPVSAEEPIPADVPSSVEGWVGNNILQARYVMSGPVPSIMNRWDFAALWSVNREFILSTGLMFDIELHDMPGAIPGLTVELGPKGYFAELAGQQKTDVFALALGVQLRYEILRTYGFAVFGSGFYSPSVITFGNAQNLYDFIAGAEMRFRPQLVGLAGYRWLKFTLIAEPSDRVSNEVFVGLRWQFK